MDAPNAFLAPTDVIESDHPQVIALACEIVSGAPDRHAQARRLFLHVRDRIRYSIHVPFFLRDHYRTTGILERGHGYCVQKASVLCALARAAGIPARLLFCDIVNHRVPGHITEMMGTNLFTFHCYDELYLGGRWVAMTPAFDRTTCEENGFPLVEFDGHTDAVLPPQDAQGRRFVEYVRHHGTFADVPVDLLLRGWEEAYGRERVEQRKQSYWNAVGRPGGEPQPRSPGRSKNLSTAERPGILVIESRIEPAELARLVDAYFQDMVKIVVDVRTRRVAVGGELHADGEQLLLERGSRQEDLWGANYYPGTGKEGCMEYTALINIRPSQGNPSMEVMDPDIRETIERIAHELIGQGEPL